MIGAGESIVVDRLQDGGVSVWAVGLGVVAAVIVLAAVCVLAITLLDMRRSH